MGKHTDLRARQANKKVRMIQSQSSEYSGLKCNVHGVKGELNVSDIAKSTEKFSNFRLVNIGSKENKFKNYVSIFGK